MKDPDECQDSVMLFELPLLKNITDEEFEELQFEFDHFLEVA